MADYDYDLYVIGAGSGGVRCARMSASYGARVAVAEERYLGGTCVNVGCVPKKLFSYGSHYPDAFEDAAGYGWNVGEHSLDWKRLIENKNREIERLNGIYRTILDNNNVTIHEARATLKDAHTVLVGGEEITADKILVATGGWPTVPDFPGKEHAITSNEAFFLEDLPERVIMVGGGYIAVEFAGILHGYGAHVTQLYRGDLFLRGFDQDLRSHLAEEMVKQGIDLRFNANIASLEKSGDRLVATLEEGSTLEADTVMYATGRAPNTRNIGLEELGVEMKKDGSIVVDDQFKSSVDNIYAIGDVIDRFQLTPVAIAEAMILSANLFNGQNLGTDYADIPTAVFSHPNIGTVGLTEEQARDKYGDVDIYRSTFKPMLHTLTGRDERTLMKLVVDKASDRVVGCHMVGPDAGEIIQGMGVALKAGATKAQFDATVGIHPTAAEEFVTMREAVSS
ncbi:MAG: glutathione-disulfide reductase [Rhodospirillaceae bacterium]|nr:glutathione-disulfide reductase [Rhodospirillaceae bacterium]|tara:strand:+ start:9900 stop:11255 length:1356 start_codon:yes stop_codon:yes gene_type:complete